ncbi:copper chaperone PCu(A)C [Bordetella avium]|uniref:Exported protein n=1 Tax=Bordetella avium (strain 197N) TaxID=360910 RepID=Q2KVB3_BORA1|nr:copper chaperone PCu(A)C [Bordetella avium]RIQ13815.1 copper chaperone PCu(A)C [Bordetella avium]RIQ17113.1 copper chaperone PCu(A)C [Bordetella avium]RIQ36161.1 copper chaperone PCu(A)C [Bordetella avium]RIQ39511.1 copper chaperone PCu(A)C [Bordetella avium]RIQ44310.1 copper chaperone PCu(A)C [Bordetella avium]
MKILKRLGASAALGLLLAATAHAQVSVDNAWIRASVPGQKSTGAFMTVRAPADSKLVEAHSDVARSTEIHEMKMEGDVMRMRQVDSVALPAGKAVELKPGGYHIMLMDLQRQMTTGEHVPLTLVTESADGKRHTQRIEVEVRPLTTQRSGNAHHKAH